MRAKSKHIKKHVAKLIRGSGGEPDPPRAPIEADDTLRSKAFVRVVDLLCEGEIVGLVDGRKSIYLNETRLQNDDGTDNFVGVETDSRNGTQDQSYLPGFSAVENEITVGIEFRYGSGVGVIRQITNKNVNRVKVRVSVPSLTSANRSNGDIGGASVDVSLWVQPDGGSYSQVASRSISGKSSSKYEVTIGAELTGTGPWNIRVQRDTPDSTDSSVNNLTYFESYTEIIDAKLKYPNSALVGMKVDAEQFGSIPTRFYDVKLMKIQVPTNYDPETREYDGIWDGTFYVPNAASDNPAWIFYDLIVNNRYGLGSYISASQIDKWALYEIAQYCDELVPDGFGGMEPRFTCNMMIADRTEAYTVLQSLASVFRGMIYWASGSVTVSQDAPRDSSYIFTPANVVDGSFTYQGVSAKTKHSVCLVSWNDPEDFYRQKVEYVEDQDAIAEMGVQETEIVAFGCTSRGQAHRLGKWLLYTEQYESETVSFKTGLDGMIARPGQIISIQDPMRAGISLGGRIKEATLDSVTVDRDISGAISGYMLQALMPDATIEERVVNGYTGRTITVEPDFTQVPNPLGMWLLKTDTVLPQTYRVIGVAEEGEGIFTITAMKHDPDKYAAVEQGLTLEPKSYSILTAAPAAPINLKVSESLYQAGTEVKTKVTFSWDKVDFAVSYRVRYRFNENNFIQLPELSFNEVDILDAQPGTFLFEVIAVSSLGYESPVSSISKEIFGKTALPLNVEGFSMIPGAGVAQLSWNKSTDLDVLIGGYVRIRHSPRTVDQLWKDAIDIIPAVPGAATTALAPLLTGTYMIKFVDSSGNFSELEKIIVTTVPDAIALNVVEEIHEEPSFAGVKTNMTIDYDTDSLVLSSGTLIDDIDLIDEIGSIDFPGGIVSSGVYEFDNVIDLGGVWPSNIRTVVDLEALDIGNFIDQRVDNIDDWDDLDGEIINDVNGELFVSTTEDDPNNIAANWTVWKRVAAAEYTARGFKFKLIVTSGSDTHNAYIHEASVTVDVADRVEHFGPLSSGTGPSAYHVTYNYPFFENPSVGITATNMNTGDYYQISNETEAGFDIVFKNSGGTIVSRSFYVIAKGYGRKVA